MIPALAPEDRLPHDRAVWREGRPDERVSGSVPVSVEYDDESIEHTVVGHASWSQVRRWRFGWPPA